jgi:hypothetical protein
MAFEGDWALLRTALHELQESFDSSSKIGSLLLCEARLAALPLIPEEVDELKEAARQIQRMREERAAAWDARAKAEFSDRLDHWQAYLTAVQQSPTDEVEAYARQVGHRAVLRLLSPEIFHGLPVGEMERLEELDKQLHLLTHPDAFAWEPEVQRSFPREGFWFLYRMVNS